MVIAEKKPPTLSLPSLGRHSPSCHRWLIIGPLPFRLPALGTHREIRRPKTSEGNLPGQQRKVQ